MSQDGAPGRRVALFDLDRTLIDCNSGRLWMQAELRAGRLGWRNAAWASFHLAMYHLGSGDAERPFEEAVATLAGQPEQDLADRTRRWFESEVQPRLRPGAAEALARHREAGDRVVLATSSTIYAARCAEAAWGIEPAVCTHFEVEQGRFTGRIASMALGEHKLTRAREWAEREAVDLTEAVFYTDSVTDLALLEAVGEPVPVHPDRKLAAVARSRGWPVADWGRSALG